VVSGNYVAAKRRGVHDGVDFGYTGEVRAARLARVLRGGLCCGACAAAVGALPPEAACDPPDTPPTHTHTHTRSRARGRCASSRAMRFARSCLPATSSC
jgi:hypothetical protein